MTDLEIKREVLQGVAGLKHCTNNLEDIIESVRLSMKAIKEDLSKRKNLSSDILSNSLGLYGDMIEALRTVCNETFEALEDAQIQFEVMEYELGEKTDLSALCV